MKNRFFTSFGARRAACALLALALLAGAMFLTGCSADEYALNNGTLSKPATEPLQPGDYAELYQRIIDVFGGSAMDDGSVAFNGVSTAVEEPTAETFATTAAPAAAFEESFSEPKEAFDADEESSVSSDSYSGTNVQVEGVDEGDILKTDGKYIYMLRRGSLTIADAAAMTELCTIRPETMEYSNAYEMYIEGDRLAIITGCDLWYKAYVLGEIKDTSEEYDPYEIPQGFVTSIVIYDISDRSAPKAVSVLSQDGNYISSRMTGGYIYCVSNEYVYYSYIDKDRPESFVPSVSSNAGDKTESHPIAVGDICIFDDSVDACYTVLTAAGIADGAKYDSAKAAFGRSGTIYSDGNVMLISASLYKNEQTEEKIDGKNAVVINHTVETDLMLYSIENGAVELLGKGVIPGGLVNQFAIDRYKGSFRFVTTVSDNKEIIYTDGIDTYDYDYKQSCALYTTDGNLNIVGSIEDLAQDEQVYSVRFDGDTAYFVTFRQVDPLFCADLSDPANPRILGQLKIPGFSEYLHKFSDTRLFGLGRDADEQTGRAGCVKLSMFDISDPVNVSEMTTLITDAYYSEALYNHKAILVSPEKGLIAFALNNQSYVVYSYDDETGFKAVCKLDGGDEWHEFFRGLFIGSSFYICSESEIKRYDMDNSFAELGTLVLSELPDIDIVTIYDDDIMELDGE